MTSDFLSLVISCIALFSSRDSRLFAATVVGGIVLAALCWFLCTVYTHLWNRRYRLTFANHVFCAVASLLTFLFVLTFASLAYTKEAALTRIDLWHIQLKSDAAWERSTFAKAYNRVKDLGIEDFSNVPPPDTPGVVIPVTRDESRQTAASTYANAACENFDEMHPFLSKIVWSRAEIPAEVVLADIRQWLQTNQVYPTDKAVELAAEQIKAGLDPQTPRVVYLSRLALIVLFLLVQALAFGLIGWAAYTDIKVSI